MSKTDSSREDSLFLRSEFCAVHEKYDTEVLKKDSFYKSYCL